MLLNYFNTSSINSEFYLSYCNSWGLWTLMKIVLMFAADTK